ncbi:signal peptidase I [Arthrobacter stackebrandtii]|uniref:Signal peptidase I n=1 Tax=Arthrobacter stackebrandtii TaxID=272161 RepID=A0ABS4YZG5_9MICC|nr:signal peptidase I [Arthrobacter stackebrandtii]PYG99334.1 signal peptidase I [Arthrobacter stackebrandtii]
MNHHSEPQEPGTGTPTQSGDGALRPWDRSARRAAGTRAGKDDGGTPGSRAAHQAWAWGKEILTIIAIAVVLSFLIKTFLFRAFFIPSGSMENTLQIDDRIFVNLLVPKPIAIERGDVVVFKDTQGWLAPVDQAPANWLTEAGTFIGLLPDSSQQHLVKRVIGLPGDRIICCNAEGKLTINGEPITEPYLYPGASPSDTPFDVTVPAGHLWVMGDHRNNSQDSRYHYASNNTGFVPIEDVEGRAVVIAWPLSHWGVLGNYPDVFDSVPDPKSASVSSPLPAPAAK